MTVRELHEAVEEVIRNGYSDLPVVVKWDDGPETKIMDATVATKQGMSFRVYPDPATLRTLA